MAYITKEEVKAKNEALKALNKEYGVKARFSGSNSSTLLLKVTEGEIDFISDFCDMIKIRNTVFEPEVIIENAKRTAYIQANQYYLDTQFSDVTLEYLQKAYKIMLQGHFDDSDIMTDYFHCAWYNHIHIGSWDKPYKLV